jgi:hypothetical protein
MSFDTRKGNRDDHDQLQIYQAIPFRRTLHPSLSAYARKLTRAWHQWQAAREIESMPIDMRKDIGWPSADNVDEHKAM